MKRRNTAVFALVVCGIAMLAAGPGRHCWLCLWYCHNCQCHQPRPGVTND